MLVEGNDAPPTPRLGRVVEDVRPCPLDRCEPQTGGQEGLASDDRFAAEERAELPGRAPEAPVADNESGDSPAEWGRAIHKDGEGRPDVFLKDIDAKHKVLTHVFWAIGKGPGTPD